MENSIPEYQQKPVCRNLTCIDRVLKDASPSGLVRRSGPAPFTVKLAWRLVLDEEPLDAPNGSCSEVYYSPEAILVMIYTSGTTGEAKRVMLTHKRPVQRSLLRLLDAVSPGGAYLHAGGRFPCDVCRSDFWALCRLQCHVSARGRSARRLRRSG
jgi:acyl-CoA synthetase (AMP-forming)/AMP-acid ligase II